MYYSLSLPQFLSVIQTAFQISWWNMNFNNAMKCTSRIWLFVPVGVTFPLPLFPTRLCIGKMTPSLILLAKCAYLETTRWSTSPGWKQTQRTTSLRLLSTRLALGHSRCPSTALQRNHVSPSPEWAIENCCKWKRVHEPCWMTLQCPQHDRRSVPSALLLIKVNLRRQLFNFKGRGWVPTLLKLQWIQEALRWPWRWKKCHQAEQGEDISIQMIHPFSYLLGFGHITTKEQKELCGSKNIGKKHTWKHCITSSTSILLYS